MFLSIAVLTIFPQEMMLFSLLDGYLCLVILFCLSGIALSILANCMAFTQQN
jgi:hypothetical protein